MYKQVTTNGTGPSGMNDNQKFDLALLEYERRYEDKRKGSFLKYKKCWEYLQDKPKFFDYANDPVRGGQKRSNDFDESAKKRPAGRDKSKSNSQLDEVIGRVRDKCGNSGESIAKSLEKFGVELQNSIRSCATGMNDAAFLQHCDPNLAKQYADLKVRQRIFELQAELGMEKHLVEHEEDGTKKKHHTMEHVKDQIIFHEDIGDDNGHDSNGKNYSSNSN